MKVLSSELLIWVVAIGWYVNWALLKSRLESRIKLIDQYRKFIEDNADKLSGDERSERMISVIREKQSDAHYLRILKREGFKIFNPKKELMKRRLERDLYG